jgi:hypothetical protein
MAINPAELQRQAAMTAPGATASPQAQPNNLANGRQQPGQKGKKTAAQKVYPKLATDGQNPSDGG